MFKKTVALLMTTGLMVGLGACGDVEEKNNDRINNQKADLVGRGFKDPILLRQTGYDNLYSATLGKCKVQLSFNWTFGAFYYVPTDDEDQVKDPSAASLLAKNIPDLKGC